MMHRPRLLSSALLVSGIRFSSSFDVKAASDSAGVKGVIGYRKRKALAMRRDASRSDRQRRNRPVRTRQLQEAKELTAALLTSHQNAAPRDVRIAQLTDALFAKGVTHAGCGTSVSWIPLGNPAMPEVAFAGRSQVGSTSLLRALFKNRVAVGAANTLGNREGINYFDVGAGTFRIAETPGMGGFAVPFSEVLRHCVLMRNFVQARPNLKMLYYLMDASIEHGATFRDLDTLKFLTQEIKNFTVVITKADAGDVPRLVNELLEHGIEHPVLATSSKTMGGVDALRFDMVSNVLHSLPTLQLTPAQANQLSDRLLSPSEMERLVYLPESHPKNTARRQLMPPDEAVPPEELAWREAALLENGGALAPPAAAAAAAATVTLSLDADAATSGSSTKAAAVDERCDATAMSTSTAVAERPLSVPESLAPVTTSDGKPLPPVLTNPEWLRFVAETSPLRNPLTWPAHVLPTANAKINVIVNPEDPDNPYLTQPRFVSARGDFNFRRSHFYMPFIPRKRPSNKGKYLPEPAPGHRRNYLDRTFSNPTFFPDIVDVNLTAIPYAYSGSGYQGFWQSPERRRLTVLSHQQAAASVVDPLSTLPGRTKYPLLAGEVQRQVEEQAQPRIASALAGALRSLPPPPAPGSGGQPPRLQAAETKNVAIEALEEDSTATTATAGVAPPTKKKGSSSSLSAFLKDTILPPGVGPLPSSLTQQQRQQHQRQHQRQQQAKRPVPQHEHRRVMERYGVPREPPPSPPTA